ncbi:hypothetical protein ACOSQ3_031884 [Xanthoceras sorbifolium]
MSDPCLAFNSDNLFHPNCQTYDGRSSVFRDSVDKESVIHHLSRQLLMLLCRFDLRTTVQPTRLKSPRDEKMIQRLSRSRDRSSFVVSSFASLAVIGYRTVWGPLSIHGPPLLAPGQ